MKKKKLVFLIIGMFLIIVPFFINVYTIYKLIFLCLGISLIDIYFALKSKPNIFLLFYLPILLLVFTYALDYFKTYTFKLSPIYVLENKINNDISIYNSLLYRVYKCENEYIFDNNYEKSFMCNTNSLKEMDINIVLSDLAETYQNHHGNFIKVTGKISKITGTNNILLESYTNADIPLNGYVKFDKNSHLKIILNGDDISNKYIYDYITVVGLLKDYNKSDNELILTDIKIEDRDLYSSYKVQVIENDNKELKEYMDNFYTYKIENIYLDYGVDKYELSYAIKDKRITFADFTNDSVKETINNSTVYKMEKLNILKCNDKKIILTNSDTNMKKLEKSYCQLEE